MTGQRLLPNTLSCPILPGERVIFNVSAVPLVCVKARGQTKQPPVSLRGSTGERVLLALLQSKGASESHN